MTTKAVTSEEPFEAGWEAARQRKLTLGLSATPSERLAWLESMIALAWKSGALPRPRADVWRDAGSTDSAGG